MKNNRTRKASRRKKFRFLGFALAIALILGMVPAAAMAIDMESVTEGALAESVEMKEDAPQVDTPAEDATPDTATGETEAEDIAPEDTEQKDIVTDEEPAPEFAQTEGDLSSTEEDMGIAPYWSSSIALDFITNYGGPDDLVRYIIPTTTPFALPSGNSLFGRPVDSEYGKFLGWSSNPSPGSPIDIGVAGERIIWNDLDPAAINAAEMNGVYAQWGSNAPKKPEEQVTVSFSAGEGGQIRQSGSTVFTLAKGGTWGDAGINVPTDLIPNSGNIFSHWELDGVEAYPNNVPADEAVTADRTYTAIFTPLADIDDLIGINFEAGENGLLKNNWSPYEGAKGTEWGKIVDRVPKAVSAYGSVFTGWELNGVPSDPREIPQDEQIFESRTYKAVFKKVSEHSVPLTVKAQDEELEWNGQQQTVTVGGSIAAGSLAEGHTLQALATGTGLAAGEYNIVLENVTILDEEGRDVSWEYDITTENGRLRILNEQETVQPPATPGTTEPPVTPDPPATPDAPDEEAPPVTPDAPDSPEPPTTPDAPDSPEQPTTPDVPGKEEPPVTPDAPGKAEPPVTPDAPEAIEPPTTPETPEAVEPPMSPEDTGTEAPDTESGVIAGQKTPQGSSAPPLNGNTASTEATGGASTEAVPMAAQEQSAQAEQNASTAGTEALTASPALADGTAPTGAELEALSDGPIPLGEIMADNWSLMNLLLTIITGVAAAITTLRSLRKRRDENAGKNSWLIWIPAVVAVVLFVATQSLSGIMAMADGWTIWFLIAAIAQAGIVLINKRKESEQRA